MPDRSLFFTAPDRLAEADAWSWLVAHLSELIAAQAEAQREDLVSPAENNAC